MSRTRTRWFASLLGLGVVAGALSVPAAPAWAAAGISVTSDLGAGVADPDHATTVTLNGSGFQSVRNGFGGVYVLFGWVEDQSTASWKPSNGGQVGVDFRYVPDSEAKDNAGFQRFIAFPGSDTESSAQAVFADDGSFSVSMVIPGAVFESKDRNGDVSEVDCRVVTCGIITIGAHGVKNANNETFTPISFETASAGALAPTTIESATPAAAATTARVGLAQPSVAAGNQVVFTAQGFTPGEQVVADFDQGVSAVGPLVAGASGEVAGALTVPTEVRSGTHVVSVRGAASGTVAEVEVVVTGGAVAAVTSTEETPVWAWVLLAGSILLAFVLVVVSIVVAIVRSVRRRRTRKAAARAAAAGGVAPSAAVPPAAASFTAAPVVDAPTVAVPVAAAFAGSAVASPAATVENVPSADVPAAAVRPPAGEPDARTEPLDVPMAGAR